MALHRLEQKIKKEEQLKAQLQSTQAGRKVLEEKLRNDRIWKHGIYAEKASIDKLDDKTLMGAFLFLHSKLSDSKLLNEWAIAGETFLSSSNSKQDKGNPFEITFKDSLPPEIKKTLRENGFKYNSIRGVWEGRGRKENVEELISPYNGIIKEI